MSPKTTLAAVLVLAGALSFAHTAGAFCGFYVSGADTKLYNNATQVVLMREGTRTILSMGNNYQGPPENFAMVVPVPVVLQKENVKTLSKEIFEHLDQLTAPRLVEYWEQDPCNPIAVMEAKGLGNLRVGSGGGAVQGGGKGLGVTVEAQFTVGEYEIVILSAKDAGGLDTWLKQEKYKIPDGAEPYFKPYVAAGSKFFVARVDVTKVKMDNGQAQLSPLRFHYDTPELGLPVRLGLINSNGTQDLIIQILGVNQRYEPANYPSVTIPTNLDVAEGSREHFARFYAALFDKTLETTPKAIVTEYSWDATTCDPCPGPALTEEDFSTLGADALPGDPGAPKITTVTAPSITDLKAAGNAEDVKNVVNRQRGKVRQCWTQAFNADSALPGGNVELKVAWNGEGMTTKSEVTKNETKSAGVAGCVNAAFQRLAIPGASPGSMTVSFGLGTTLSTKHRDWTITRLHARYSKESLGQDITFKTAPPLVGGREIRNATGDLEHGGSKSGTNNNFQGRYVIRHPWTGAVTCKEPKRGVWGGPWPDAGAPNHGTISARKVALVPRGGIDLASFIRSDAPEIGLKAGSGPLAKITPLPGDPNPSPSATSSSSSVVDASPEDAGAASSPPAPKGCGSCSTSASPPVFEGAIVALAAGLARWRSSRRAKRK